MTTEPITLKNLKYFPKLPLLLLSIGLGIICIKILLRVVIFVPVGQVGIVETSLAKSPLLPGLYWFNPLETVTLVSTRIRVLTETLEVTSKEGINFNLKVGLQYQVDPQSSELFYEKVGDNETAIILANLSAALRSVVSQQNLANLYSDRSDLITMKVRQSLQETLKPLGLTVNKVTFQGLVLPETIQATLKERFTAQQLAEKRKIEAKGLADALKQFKDYFPQKTIINIAADDSVLRVQEPK